MIAIIDYGAGNIGSLCNALDSLGADYCVTRKPDEILAAKRVIFPGQGRAGAAMKSLKLAGLDNVIKQLTVPFLGICLGMQLLLDYSEEDRTECLGIIPGRVNRFSIKSGFSVPQMGWNSVSYSSLAPCFSDIPQNTFFYFANSYFVDSAPFSQATSNYAHIADVVIQRNNFLGVQFHPEKSGNAGMQFLKNFLSWQPKNSYFTVYPAIDLIDGSCVRLSQGDYSCKTNYQKDPVLVAQEFESAGAQFLHVVDLDGARIGQSVNFDTVKKIVQNISIPVQLGGGIRDFDTAQRMYEMGVQRLILGTSIFENSDLLKRLLSEFGSDRIVVSLDFIKGQLAINGWKEMILDSLDFVMQQLAGVKTLIVTDIEKDGMQSGPNFKLAQSFVNLGFEIIVAGGVSSPSDVQRLKSLNIDGAIIGKALYESSYTVSDFLRPQVSLCTKLPKRIIPCLDIDNGQVVKGVNFLNTKLVGDALECAILYEKMGADELVFLDISASIENRSTLNSLVRLLAANLHIPFTIGGGIKNVFNVRDLLLSGADKVSIGSAAIRTPQLINEIAENYGSQCLVISVDAKKNGDSWTVYLDGGRVDSRIDVIDFIHDMEKRGAGELLINSIDFDGTKNGYDIPLLKLISENTSLPIIASSGAGDLTDFTELFRETSVDAALAASIFHERLLTIAQVKDSLLSNNILIRENT